MNNGPRRYKERIDLLSLLDNHEQRRWVWVPWSRSGVSGPALNYPAGRGGAESVGLGRLHSTSTTDFKDTASRGALPSSATLASPDPAMRRVSSCPWRGMRRVHSCCGMVMKSAGAFTALVDSAVSPRLG